MTEIITRCPKCDQLALHTFPVGDENHAQCWVCDYVADFIHIPITDMADSYTADKLNNVDND